MAQTLPHKRNVNTVFQNYALFPHMTVEENVAFGLRYKKASKQETKERVGRAIELVQLRGFEKRSPASFPGAAAAGGARSSVDPEPRRAPPG